jgi:uncharacterized phosphatase
VTRLTLIRHGRTAWNAQGRIQGSSDIPLDEVGLGQARDAAERLAASGETWDAIVSSPLMRARRTAEILAERLGVPLGATYPEWTEQHFGIAEGLSDAEVERRWPDWRPPEKEPDEAVVLRGSLALQRLRDEFGDRSVIVVAHGTIIRYALSPLTGRPYDHYPSLENLSTSTAHHVEGSWRVLTIGNVTI